MNPKRLKFFEEKRQRIMAEHAGDGKIVDVGFANFPNPFLRGHVIGVDLHPAKCPPSYSEVLQANALDLPFEDGSLDAVVAGELLEHLTNPTLFLLECNRVLRRPGRCIVSVPNPYHPSDIVNNIRMSNANLFTNSHLVAPAYRVMRKLLELCGFELLSVHGDFLRIPKVHWLIPMERFPGLAYRNIYVAQKHESVDQPGFDAKLSKIHAHEAQSAHTRFDAD